MNPARKDLDMAKMSLAERVFLASAFGFAVGVLGLELYDCPPEMKGTPYLVGEDGRASPTGKPLECRSAKGELFYTVHHDDWQGRFFRELDRHGARIALKTANGAGKSSICAAGAILWHMAIHPRSKTVVYSASHRQLQTQLWPAILQRAAVLDPAEWEFQPHSGTIRHVNGSIAIIFSTNDPGKAEGHHGCKRAIYDIAKEQGPLLIIIDEAKTVPAVFFQAFDRCTYQRLVLMSSTGSPEGDFYEAMKAGSAFTKIEAPASVCPHADHAKNAEIIVKRGLDHPLVQSTIFARFMEEMKDATISWKAIRECLEANVVHQPGRRVVFCDFAAGGDENVLALADGNKAELIRCWKEKDTVKAAGEFVALFHRLRLKPGDIYGDASGLGVGFWDQIGRMGWPINRVFNQEKPRDAAYANRAAEMWGEICDAIKRKEVILPDDDTMVAQLAGRKWSFAELGKVRLESKEDMRERGLESPDRAEATLNALYWANAHVQRTAEEEGWLPRETTYATAREEFERGELFTA
jgi:phage terminase large subunit